MARILVVEDDPAAGEALGKLLRKAGHEVTCAANGRLALTHVLTDTPDVVLLDLVMPDMDGPSFLKVVRSYLRFQTLPVIVLTALEDNPLLEEAAVLNVSAVLVKAKSAGAEILRAIEDATS